MIQDPDTLASTEDRRNLDRFLANNDELEELSARLSTFNIFGVLRIASAEIRHSNVLAWLLTPGETHGLGDYFLRRFLSTLLLENELPGIKLTPSAIELAKFDDVETLREWKNIDVLVRSATGRWCLLIENKVRSKESPGQLQKYHQSMKEEMGDGDIIPVFLTLQGDDPSEDGYDAGYVALGYDLVLEIVDRAIDQHAARIPSDALVFVRHYREILRRLTMQDQELENLCKQIYRKHRDAIDMIVEIGASSEILEGCLEAANSFTGTDGWAVGPHVNRIWLTSQDMSAAQQKVGTGWKFLNEALPVMWWFYYQKDKGKLQLTLEVGQMEDPELRRAIVESLTKHGFSARDAGFRPEAKYTRVLTKVGAVAKDEEGEVDTSASAGKEAAVRLWKQVEQRQADAVEALKAVPWPK